MAGQLQDAERWLTVDQVAEQLQVNPETVRRWIRNSELAALDIGGPRGGYRVRPSDLEAFIAVRYRPGGQGKAAA